ncbi:MAG: tRNA (adenosine(37)-N6)-dimethylallyltransferase MiaA [Gemmatimonadetes bacterium]|nr:tRNA (adenosine(37)-N6)-dimethylallyltransferase MiaA [Gemmatimonadota bacterium]
MGAGRIDRALRVICGPTAAGKSAVAMALAAETGATIISADARHLYRGFDVGTAKPSRDERARVPHIGLDVAEPGERWSAGRWATAAAGWLAGLASQGREALVAGGTGFYVQALVAPLHESPPLDPGGRAALDAVIGPLPLGELRRWCAALDPARAHLGRTQLLRAIETVLLSGRRLSDAHASVPAAPPRAARYLVVDPGRQLSSRIEARVDAMLAGGWVDEVRRLLALVPPTAPAWTACGYRALQQYVLGEVTLADARESIIVATRQYAKRQRTWLRHQLDAARVTRIDPTDPSHLDVARAWWHDDEAGTAGNAPAGVPHDAARQAPPNASWNASPGAAAGARPA